VQHIVNGVTINIKDRVITHRGKTWRWNRSIRGQNISFRFLCNLIKHPSLTMQQHFDRLYGHLESGGPEMGVNQLHLLVHRLRPVMLKLELEIVAVRARRSSSNCCVYMVIAIDEEVRIAA
jgi:hypothetical protein